MKIVTIAFIAVLAALFAGCTTTTTPVQETATPKITVPFDEAALQPYVGDGTSTITGQAFLKTAGGDVKYGAGNDVLLIPVTAYTSESVKEFVGCTSPIVADIATPKNDLRLQKYIRTVVADGSGNFEFQHISAGDYFIVCPIFWSVPNIELGITDDTGGVAFAKAHVSAGESVKVVVTLQ